MLCKKCGKEFADQSRFCPECGTPVEVVDVTGKTQQTTFGGQQKEQGKGIYVEQNFDTLKQLTDRAHRNEKRWKTIGKFAAVVYVLFIVKGLFTDLVSVAEGSSGMGTLVSGLAAMILFACGLIYLFTEIWFPAVKVEKSACTQECIGLIHVNDNMQLVAALNQMNSSAVKKAYMDESGSVCVQGKKGKHIFSVSDGRLTLNSDSNQVKAALEREAIAASLIKYLEPLAPVNAYENERSNARLGRTKMVLGLVALVSGFVFVLVLINPQWQEGHRQYIEFVKEGYPELYPDVNYGDAFEAYFSDCSWEYFESVDHQDVVEFHGTCLYGGENANVTIQFLLSYEEQSFEVYALEINGEAQQEYTIAILLADVFEGYVSE